MNKAYKQYDDSLQFKHRKLNFGIKFSIDEKLSLILLLKKSFVNCFSCYTNYYTSSLKKTSRKLWNSVGEHVLFHFQFFSTDQST